MSFSMNDDEIRVSYNTAKDRKAQVKVLAELNATTPEKIVEKLLSMGCDVPALPKKQKKQKLLRAKEVLFDEARARTLFAEGKSDLECAEMLGISKYAFATWRRKNGMNRYPGIPVKNCPPDALKAKPCKAQPPLPPEAETPDPVPAPESAARGSQTAVAAVDTRISAGLLGQTLVDLEKRYPGLTITVNGAAVRSLCLNVRVLINGNGGMSSTLDLEVG